MQRQGLAWRQREHPIVLVPTMGFLHSGHASLITRARHIAGSHGKVVVSIFVNPTQFSPSEDFSRYPRSEASDLSLCRDLGADVVFVPRVGEIYPTTKHGAFSTYVTEEALSHPMEGISRPIHFRGVATVVSILFHIVQPTHAIFGEKDFQQVAVIKKMTHDLHIPTKIITSKTVREQDGLAVSSRNAYLNSQQRPHANVLWKCLQSARARLKSSNKPQPATQLRKPLEETVRLTPGAALDYIEFFDPFTLKPVKQVNRSHRMALAVRFGKTRLIDNGKL